MKILAKTTQSTTASPTTIYALWADIDHWTDHDPGIEWARLTDNFSAGGHYMLKPKGGPKVKADILVAEPPKRFIDVSRLPGAKLRFDHIITQGNSQTFVTITMTLSGPWQWMWAKILGKNQQADLEQSTANLIARAEGRS